MKPLLLIVIFCIPILWNLLKPGFYTSHDGEWMVIRLTAFHQALRDGQLPVRWLPRLNHGYGYPVTNFLYPLPFYVAEPFYVLTGNPATAVQIVMGLSVLSMGFGMFGMLGGFGKSRRLEAFVGTLAYIYSPYVAYNLDQRGSLGELVAMGIVPWVFWAIRARWWPAASVLLAGLITAHNVVAILFTPIVVGYLGILGILEKRRKQPSLLHASCFMLLAGLGMSVSFWLPALVELRFVRASTIAVSEFQNEYLTVVESLKRTGILVTFTNLGFPLYFLTDLSKGFWETFKPLQIIQFPWRLLSVFSFTGAVLTAFFLSRLQRKKTLAIIFGVIVLFISFQSSQSFRYPLSAIRYPPSYYETNDDTTTVRAEYTPIWVEDLPRERPSEPAIHYYPGRRAFVDGKEAAIADPNTTNGILKTADSIDPSRVRLLWSETPLRAISNLISLISFVALLMWEHRRQQKQERGQRSHIRASA